MKQNKFPQIRNPADDSRPTAVTNLNQSFPPSANEIDRRMYLSAGGNISKDFVPSPDEVARRAYFSYVNQGSPQGREVQHWLEAEKQLLAERQLTRIHGFHNKT